jgi:predicted MPP superfamily phosphohydrolase
MFFLFALFMMFLLHGYVGIRFIAPFALSPAAMFAYWTLISILAAVPIAAMVLRFKGIENGLIDILLWIGYSSLGMFSLAFVMFLLRDVGWMTGTALGKIGSIFKAEQDALGGPEMERRQFIILAMNWGILGLTILLGVIGFFQARFKPLIQKVEVPMGRFSKALESLKIVQISDLHVGPTIKAAYVQQVVDRINALEPDLIFFTGDMVDGSVQRLKNDVEPLRQLRSRYGTFFVTGNHEYYSGAEHWVEKTKELGMKPLMNEHVVLDVDGDKLVIAGVTDFMAHQMLKHHRSDPKKALDGAPKGLPTILLAHQPGTADQIRDLDIDLMVCGHTHGGQYIPFNWAVAKAHKYTAGLYQQDQLQVYVNQGTGYWGPPIRLGIPSEITLFNLVPKV